MIPFRSIVATVCAFQGAGCHSQGFQGLLYFDSAGVDNRNDRVDEGIRNARRPSRDFHRRWHSE